MGGVPGSTGSALGTPQATRGRVCVLANGPEMPPKCTQGLEGKHGFLGIPSYIVSIPDTEKKNAKSFLAFSVKHVITNTSCKKF